MARAQTTASPPPGHLRPLAPAAFGYPEARHLLWRAGFGGTPTQIRALTDWGIERAVGYLVDPDGIADPAPPAADTFEAGIMRPPTREERAQYRRAQRGRDENALARFRAERQRRQRSDRQQIRQMQRWWLERMIETPRPLEEKMTLFWHGHFATSYRTIENSYHMYLQNQLFREHALGNFGDLLFAIIRDPAMLKYLDNDRNRRGAPNENLAREIMELFALGEGNYDERDIKEGARALTGYTFEFNDFLFDEARHDPAPKRIFGTSGNFDGDDFVRMILERRACSEFIAAKLYAFFVRSVPLDRRDPLYEPATRVIRRMASTLLRARYELGPVLSELFRSEHFHHPAFRCERIKSPVELVVGAVRSLGTPVRDLGVLNDALGLMGQQLFFPPNVAGWEGGRTWINTSTLYVRQNILAFLLTGKTPAGDDPLARVERYDPSHLLDDLAKADPGAELDPERVVPYVLRFMLGGAEPDHAEASLEAFIDQHGGRVGPQVVTGVLALVSAMPEYQLI